MTVAAQRLETSSRYFLKGYIHHKQRISYAEVLCPAEQGGSYTTALEGKCPTCRKPISKSKRRMLGKL